MILAAERGASILGYCIAVALLVVVGLISLEVFGGGLRYTLCVVSLELRGAQRVGGTAGRGITPPPEPTPEKCK